MEGSLGETKQVERIFLHEIFEEVAPYFISIGMTYEQFWYGDVSMTKVYQKAYEMKEEREMLKARWGRWEQGLYIYEALCDVAPILRAFSKAKKPLQYPKQPYGIEDMKEKHLEEESLKEYEKSRAEIFFKNWANSVQKRFEEKGEK